MRIDLNEPENDEFLPSVRQLLANLGFKRNNSISIQIVLFIWSKKNFFNKNKKY